jgi:two-component system, LuxR family, response regulator FixJ
MSVRQQVHIIDDDPGVLESTGFLLRLEGFDVRTFGSALDFLNAVKLGDKGCILTDMRMPVMTGIDLLLKVTERRLLLPVIVMSAEADFRLVKRAMELGAVGFIVKPFDADTLLASIEKALAVNESRDEDVDAAKLILAGAAL